MVRVCSGCLLANYLVSFYSGTSTYVVEIRHEVEDNYVKAVLDCPCLFFKDNGLVCVHLLKLLVHAKQKKIKLPGRDKIVDPFSGMYIAACYSTDMMKLRYFRGDELSFPEKPEDILKYFEQPQSKLDEMMALSFLEDGYSTLPCYPYKKVVPKSSKDKAEGDTLGNIERLKHVSEVESEEEEGDD